MKPKNGYVIVALLAMVCAVGCSSSKPYCKEKGRLNAQLHNSKEKGCGINFQYRNMTKHKQKPLIDIVANDDTGKVLFHDKVYFDEIDTNVSQVVFKKTLCDDRKASKIYISDAVNLNRCYGYECSPLCEIKATTINLSK